jgi:hypothetical protein
MDFNIKNFIIFIFLYLLTTFFALLVFFNILFYVNIGGGTCSYIYLPFPTIGKYTLLFGLEQTQYMYICKTNYIGIVLNILLPILSFYFVFIKKVKLFKWLLLIVLLVILINYYFFNSDSSMIQPIKVSGLVP